MTSHQNGNSSFHVVIRARPSPHKESKSDPCIQIEAQEVRVTSILQTIPVGKNDSSQRFTFDHVFPPTTNQKEFYTTSVNPLVHSCLDGYNATILAYGQTGSGKTHTMMGDSRRQDDEVGVIPRALEDIFLGLEQKTESHKEQIPLLKSSHSDSANIKNSSLTLASSTPPFEYQVKVQFLELYGEAIFDLVGEEITDQPQSFDRESSLKRNKTYRRPTVKKAERLVIRDGKDGEDANVPGACQAKVQSSEEALKYLRQGMKMRHTGQTAMNAKSSRSHAIFTVMIQQTQRKVPSTDDDSIEAEKNSIIEMKTSNIHFVDLAGSESIKKAKTRGKRMQEGININKGLTVLGNVISFLCDESKGKKKHVPYRESKLTRLLQGSLGGNHKTLMIGCVSPCDSNRSETVNTLRYANRAKSIKNDAKVNIDPCSSVINELQDQVTSLAMELLRVRSADNFDEAECPFSEEFLASLIQASHTARGSPSPPTRPSSAPSLKNTSPSIATRPSSAPVSTDICPSIAETNSLPQLTESDDSTGSITELSTKMCGISEDVEESNNSIDNPGNNVVDVNDKTAFYALVRKSMRNLSTINHLEDETVEEDNVDTDTETEKCRRVSWRDTFRSTRGPNVKSLNIVAKDSYSPANHSAASKDIYKCVSWSDTFRSTRDPNVKSLNIVAKDSYSPAKLSADSKDLDKPIDFEMNENKTIALYDCMRASMRDVLNGSICLEHKTHIPPYIGVSSNIKVKFDCFQTKDSDDSEDLEKAGNFEMNGIKTITFCDSMRTSDVSSGVTGSEYKENVQPHPSDNPNSAQEAEVKDQYSSYKHIDLSDTNIGSIDENIRPNDNLIKIMDKYHDEYEILKLNSEIRLIKSKIENYTKEKTFLDGINDELKSKRLHSIEVEKSISVTENMIIMLQKREVLFKRLIQLIK